jgi:IS5 family transposase
MKSKIHPKFKTKYRVGNWPDYDQSLVNRGDITLWISAEAIDAWIPSSSGRRGGQRKFSDHAIETALALRLVFQLPLRQTEGFLRSVLAMMGVDVDAPDHTTLSRRSQHLEIELRPKAIAGPIHLIVDSTGLSIVGEGEWAAVQHGGSGKRGWRKLHIGVDDSGVIVARMLTKGNVDDAKSALEMIGSLKGKISSFTADGAYDTIAIYKAVKGRGGRVIIPPIRTAIISRGGPRSTERDHAIKRMNEIGRRLWKKESGYHLQGRAENTFFRYEQIFGPRLHARHPLAQAVEAKLACSILNRMTGLGQPESIKIGL